MVVAELWGWLLIFAGLFFIVAMPSIREYMPDQFQNTIVLIGVILVGVGVFLVVKT